MPDFSRRNLFSHFFSRKIRESLHDIEEARQARYDIRYFVQLSLAEQGDMEKIKISLCNRKILTITCISVKIRHDKADIISTLAERENIPFHALVSLPADLSIDED